MKLRLTKLLIAIASPAGMLIGVLISPIIIFDNRPVRAAPAAQFSITTPIWRVLDTSGDGTGTTNATGNYTTTTAFYIQPPAASTYVLDQLIVSVEDSAVITYNSYGATTVITGVVIQRVGSSETITLTNTVPITANQGWRRYCEVDQTNAGGTHQLQAICDLRGMRLNGDQSEQLKVLLNDDYSGLDAHYFAVQGYKQ